MASIASIMPPATMQPFTKRISALLSLLVFIIMLRTSRSRSGAGSKRRRQFTQQEMAERRNRLRFVREQELVWWVLFRLQYHSTTSPPTLKDDYDDYKSWYQGTNERPQIPSVPSIKDDTTRHSQLIDAHSPYFPPLHTDNPWMFGLFSHPHGADVSTVHTALNIPPLSQTNSY